MLKLVNFQEPLYYHREFINDIHSKLSETKAESEYSWIEASKRIGVIVLPFLSLYQPFNTMTSFVMGVVRTGICAKELFICYKQGDNGELPLHLLNTAIAVIALVSTSSSHSLVMLCTTGHDLIIEVSNILTQIKEEKFQESLESSIKILNNALYLGLILGGGLELVIASLVLQVLINLFQSYEELEKKNYLESIAHALMAMIRTSQLVQQVKILHLVHEILREIEKTKNPSRNKISKSFESNEGMEVLHAIADVCPGQINVDLGSNPVQTKNVLSSDTSMDKTILKNFLIEYVDYSEKLKARGSVPRSHLLYALEKNYDSIALYFISEISGNYSVHNTNKNPLIIAIKKGKLNLVDAMLPKFLYKTNFPPNYVGIAISHIFENPSGLEILKLLITVQWMHNSLHKTHNFDDIIRKAIQLKNYDVLSFFFNSGIYISTDALFLAVENNDIETVKWVLNHRNANKILRSLEHAIKMKYTDITDLLSKNSYLVRIHFKTLAKINSDIVCAVLFVFKSDKISYCYIF